MYKLLYIVSNHELGVMREELFAAYFKVIHHLGGPKEAMKHTNKDIPFFGSH
jgi:hypothetical protein